MESVVATVSGYHGSERFNLIKLIASTGANYVGSMSPSITHLVCWKFEGRKYELAKKFKTVIVSHRWIEECVKKGCRVSETPYTFQSGQEVGTLSSSITSRINQARVQSKVRKTSKEPLLDIEDEEANIDPSAGFTFLNEKKRNSISSRPHSRGRRLVKKQITMKDLASTSKFEGECQVVKVLHEDNISENPSDSSKVAVPQNASSGHTSDLMCPWNRRSDNDRIDVDEIEVVDIDNENDYVCDAPQWPKPPEESCEVALDDHVDNHRGMTQPNLSCIICWTDFSPTRGVLPCGHRFCFLCIQNWAVQLASKKKPPTCPLCKAGFICITKVEDALFSDQKIYSQTILNDNSKSDVYILPDESDHLHNNPSVHVCFRCSSREPEDLLVLCHYCQVRVSAERIWEMSKDGYWLNEYQPGLQKALINGKDWFMIQKCYVDFGVCNVWRNESRIPNHQPTIGGRNYVELGCCYPPARCKLVQKNGTSWDNPMSEIDPSDKECTYWTKSDNVDHCYDCDSCKAGYLTKYQESWQQGTFLHISEVKLMSFLTEMMRKRTPKIAPFVALFILLTIPLYYPSVVEYSSKKSSDPETIFEDSRKDTSNPCSSLGDTSRCRGDGPDTEAEHHDAGDSQCDLFSGEWVPNPEGPYYTNETCYAIQEHQNCMRSGRPDIGFLKWRWKPDGCELPVFDPLRFLELVKGKSLAFVGDSVARNHMQSLICLLASKAGYPVDSSPSDQIQNKRYEYPSYDFNISMFWSPFLVNTANNNQEKPPFTVHLDHFHPNWTTQIASFDYVIISSGHWFTRPSYLYLNNHLIGCVYCAEPNITHLNPSFSCRWAFRTAFRAITSAPGFRGVAFVRTFSPSHFEGGAWDNGGKCARTRPFKRNETVLEGSDLEMYLAQVEEMRLAQRAEWKNGGKLDVLDVTKIMLMRPDGHPNKYSHLAGIVQSLANDCVHWCLPGPIDSWNDILQEMVRRETGNKIT
ncbi:hypothetical protein F511_02261 [Dorcoceras hygrometricum]|uniref:RING-type E3 ubiquitin transferase BRCA1 n=1 Tax=Dorcoceras hygrometricum TaxID=472368 RepID=A0A2Z7CEX3_9LAMI|nr:hypothetical protein F511_02261 [Dorcoceras hygrometricum]